MIDTTADITNAITGTYVAVDVTKPTLKVIAPTSKTVAISNLFTATGTASDNAGVALVYYQLNGGAWTTASSGNSFTNWTAPNLNLTPGPNVIRFYAKDLSGNLSATNSVTFTFLVSAPVAVDVNIPGSGTVSPNLNGAVEAIGKVLSMSAKAAKGYAFVNWTGATNSSSAKIGFVMASNLTFTANFKDIARPVNVILTPKKGEMLSGASIIATGRASDNRGGPVVWYRVNSGAWTEVNHSDGTNWQTADLSALLLAGPNTISAYAVDAAGNISLTNTIAFSYVVQAGADWAPDSFNGLLASVSPNGGAQSVIGFDVTNFAQASPAKDLNPDEYGGGTYVYVKTDTNMAQLSLAFSEPAPGATNSIGPITLVFTNHYAGYFTNGDSNTGGINLAVATPFIPASLVGKTISAVSSQNSKTTKIKFSTATTFTKTPSNNSSSGSSSGTYVFTRFSPICGVVNATFTSPADAGQTAYLQLTFTSAKGGTYFVMSFDNLGVLQDVDVGTFSM